ncbi:hypothetical protein JIG36_26620 [Actinoplanes sp. LDG1-06]|uniref:Integral membrane protein n=1 Tax=Paractinoplanes ovalisporus TaxID=2810368 RepID=A0ABS2AIE6_9ACTN|nr:hypothetical protein [Actinoplanes ovalisporus]MBM2619133.1 hypothetical protein [Actinoplanes ovalisporus]
MSTSSWTMLAGGVAGAVLAVFGLVILLTGRAPEPTARAFRNVRDAGFYHFLFGTALGLVVIATSINAPVVTVMITVIAVAMAGTALVRFRPRGRRRPVNR